jgi:hypothetical protein
VPRSFLASEISLSGLIDAGTLEFILKVVDYLDIRTKIQSKFNLELSTQFSLKSSVPHQKTRIRAKCLTILLYIRH